MRKLVYDVALSVDNFMSHEDGGVDGFSGEGEHVTDYAERLKSYDTVVMGKNTYEVGYRYGLQPGKPAYPGMKHYIFSKTLRFEKSDPSGQVQIIDRDELAFLRKLKEGEGTSIYLCGGGDFAGFLLDHELIDQLVIKLNPLLISRGVRAFGHSSKKVMLSLVECKAYTNGVVLLRYDLKYGQELSKLVLPEPS